ncbi:MAG: hypothetical protein ABSF24_02860 [Candidatus Bathyarchaeia archaeon]|jgi:hypothetical protein
MSNASGAESILDQAFQREKSFDWLGAVECYRKARGIVSIHDFLRVGDIHESGGYALHRAAMQAEGPNEFRERMRQAVAEWEKAKECYGSLGKIEKTRAVRCDAMIAYSSSWLTSETSEKKRLLDESWRLTKECLTAFDKAENPREYGRTYNRLLAGALYGFLLEWDYHARLKRMKEALEHGERAISLLSASGDPELVKTYIGTGLCEAAFTYYFREYPEKEEGHKKTRAHWEKAKELSKETAAVELLSDIALTGYAPGDEGSDEALKTFEEALDYGRKTKDRLITGSALAMLAYHTWWKKSDYPEETIRLMEKGLQYAEEAKNHFSQISFTSVSKGVAWAEFPYPEYYRRAASIETDMDKRRQLIRKAVEAAPEALKRALASGFEENAVYAHHMSRTVLTEFAEAEEDAEEKKSILEKTLQEANECVKLVEQVETHNYWDRGIMQGTRSRVEYDLALLERDPEKKKNVLQDAVLDMEAALKLCRKGLVLYEGKAPHSMLILVAAGTSMIGDTLDRLYKLTNDKEYLKKAAVALAEAAETFQQIDMKNLVAECLWKAARVYDDSGEYMKAAQNFDLASDNYKNAAEKVPQLKELYTDHSLYMQAWSEIEKARHHHVRQEYGLAKEHFEKAADMHKSLKQWNYLEPNYAAWAHIENAEELSRKDQCEESIRAFEQAADLLKETKKSIQTRLPKIEKPDEKEMAVDVLNGTDLRLEYCTARVALEEARILDKKGDHYSSSEHYCQAAETFGRMVAALESEQERNEVRFMISLSQAWQKMTMAEAEASPKLYAEASELFEKAKDFCPNEKTKMLVLGHSHFCKALEAGTTFVDTRDLAAHDTALQQLASASNYYVRADFENASEYAKATRLLFDAFAYMDKAEKENEPEKKTRLYAMAEKILQTSAGSYTKAEHPEKREQVLRLLEKTMEERELATSLAEVLHAPSIVSTTATFTAPTPTREEAVGSERFEHADIQANVIIRPKELKVGENLDLELEIVNAGRGPALLMKVTELILQDFDLVERPEKYRVEDSYVNMKGKRLDPLKTEELRISLRPRTQGVFELKPRVLYLDENGKYRVHELEPVSVIVKELGIKGWLKGEK